MVKRVSSIYANAFSVIEIFFVSLGKNLNFTSDYELSINGSAPVNMASLMGSAGVTEAVTAATLTSDTSYKFEVRTTFLCTEGSVTKTSNYVEALTYTRPEKPVITSVSVYNRHHEGNNEGLILTKPNSQKNIRNKLLIMI